jgi:hypothetical protein
LVSSEVAADACATTAALVGAADTYVVAINIKQIVVIEPDVNMRMERS